MNSILSCYDSYIKGIYGSRKRYDLIFTNYDYPRYLRLISGCIKRISNNKTVGYITFDRLKRREMITESYRVIEPNKKYWEKHYIEPMTCSEDCLYIFRDRLPDGGVRSIILNQEQAEEEFGDDKYFRKLHTISKGITQHEAFTCSD